MTEDSWRMNPILMHFIEDFQSEGMNIDEAISASSKEFLKIPINERELNDKPWHCPVCSNTFSTEKEND